MRARALILLWLAVSGSLGVAAQQQHQSLEKGFQADKVYHFGDIDSVNVFNGNLVVTMPIGPAFPLNGGLSYQLRLSYNSKAWDLDSSTGKVHADPSSRSNAGMGWVFGLGRFVPRDDPRNESNRNLYEAPDGGDHRFYDDRTRDGSNLRLRRSGSVAEVDFPDGTVHKFVKTDTSSEYRLAEIRGAIGTDKVTVTYVAACGATTPCPAPCLNFDSAWTIKDSLDRAQYACFRNRSVNNVSRPMIAKVVVSSTPTRPYLFTYIQNNAINKPPEDTDFSNDWRQTHSAPILTQLELPDQSAYQMSSTASALLQTLTLPTLGKIAYEYTTYLIPSLDFCANNYGFGLGFGAKTVGVTKRTLTSVVPEGQAADSRVWRYEPSLSPAPGSASGYMSVYECAPGDGLDQTKVKVQLYDEMLVRVTDPAGNVVVNHFSVWPGNDHGRLPDEDISPAGFDRRYYGWPYGAKDPSGNRYLSQEFFACTGSSCTPKRSVYIRHERDTTGTPYDAADPEAPHRLVYQRTVLDDDCAGGTCDWTESESDLWDGYGHYRRTRTKGSAGAERTVQTSWNTLNGVDRTFADGDPWVLNTYEDITTTEGTATAREQACFDTGTGFLRGKRALVGATPGATDLAVTFGADADGNLETEKYFGGDGASLPVDAVLCTAMNSFPATPASTVSHAWQNGRLKTSQYDGLAFKHVDLTTDSSGRVTASRDEGGFTTSYVYNAAGQLEKVTPPGMAATTYTYSNATAADGALTKPAMVEAVTTSSSGDVKAQYQYDSFGRLWREKRLMPSDDWNMRQTLYDGLDRRRSVSEVVSLKDVADELAYVPTSTTLFSYDAFGRVTRVAPPDSEVVGTVRTEYVGARQVTRKVRTATAAGMTDVSTVEIYDAHGRLISVTEGDVTTSYSHDVAGRLTEVRTGPAANPQTRVFKYDNRGLLISEKHPELGRDGYGTIGYSRYDARGRAGRTTVYNAKNVNGLEELSREIEIDTMFDVAGRVKSVSQVGLGTLIRSRGTADTTAAPAVLDGSRRRRGTTTVPCSVPSSSPRHISTAGPTESRRAAIVRSATAATSRASHFS